MFSTRSAASIAVVTALVMTVALGSVAAQQQAVTVDPTPSGPNEAESTHALTFAVGDSAVADTVWEDVLLDYSVDAPSADVSNVGARSIERVGIDRGNDDPGSQVDIRAAEITEVSGQADGNALRISLAGDRTIQQGDQLVVVIRPVQNPQNAGTANVDVTVNTQGAAVSQTGSVTYEQHDATVTASDQTSAGETVVVDEVTLSEGGFVAVQNASGASSDEIRGTSAYLDPGTHEDVEVTLDAPIDSTQDLVVQSYTDSNADRGFDYTDSGGEVDGPYRNGDDNIIGSDTLTVTYDADATATETETPTETETATPTETETATSTESQTDTPTETESGSDTDSGDATMDTETELAQQSPVTDSETTAGGTEAAATASPAGSAGSSGGSVTSALIAALLVVLLFVGATVLSSS